MVKIIQLLNVLSIATFINLAIATLENFQIYVILKLSPLEITILTVKGFLTGLTIRFTY